VDSVSPETGLVFVYPARIVHDMETGGLAAVQVVAFKISVKPISQQAVCD
jgi:hypothetical protein